LGESFGYICIGNAGKNNQQGTMLVELNGQGCINAKAGWEQRLHDFLANVALRPSITRIDLAHDDMDGERVSPDWAELQWLAGTFTKQAGKNPSIERVGNWHEPNGSGRTLYIGSRKHSSLFVRCYEKGKEQGDPLSPWTRLELEIKNSDRIIPLDILLRPSDYFIATYPALTFLSAYRTPERIKVKRQKAQIGVAASKSIIKHQFGKSLRVLRVLHDGDTASLLDDLVCDDPDAWPDRLRTLAADADTFDGDYLHDIILNRWDIESGRYVPAVADDSAMRVH
jgi:phage replication initiation protein